MTELLQRDLMALQFDGAGGCDEATLQDVLSGPDGGPDTGFVWLHLKLDAADTPNTLNQLNLDPFVIDALLAEETRPRCTVHGDGALINLRGVNLSPGAAPEDMVSVRFWVEERRVIGLRRRPLFAVSDLLETSLGGNGPVTTSDLIAKLALRLADRAEPVVASLNERIDALEEMLDDAAAAPPKGELADIRRVSIILRRYMFPQRDALTTFEIEDLFWITDRDRSRVREAAERVTRLGEELDAIRDRAQVVHDQIMDRRAETMNRQMLVLSVVSAVFLPMGLLTGLLGINVAGIPGASTPWAFWAVCGILVAMGLVQLWLYRKLGLFK